MHDTDKPDIRALAGLTWLMDTILGQQLCCVLSVARR
jgi:hypothetical protein